MSFDDTEVMICTNVSVSQDGLVEMDETLQLHLTTDDVAVILVEPFIADITIINSDGECMQCESLISSIPIHC